MEWPEIYRILCVMNGLVLLFQMLSIWRCTRIERDPFSDIRLNNFERRLDSFYSMIIEDRNKER